MSRPKNNLLALVRNMGPGFLVAVGFIDPGNIAAGVLAGASFASTITGMMASAYGAGAFVVGSQHHGNRPLRWSS